MKKPRTVCWKTRKHPLYFQVTHSDSIRMAGVRQTARQNTCKKYSAMTYRCDIWPSSIGATIRASLVRLRRSVSDSCVLIRCRDAAACSRLESASVSRSSATTSIEPGTWPSSIGATIRASLVMSVEVLQRTDKVTLLCMDDAAAAAAWGVT